jgi:hypothetical protein
MVRGGVAVTAAAVDGVDGFALRFLEIGVGGAVERRGELAACWSTPFEEVPPVRQFPSFKGQKNFPGLYFASGMGRHIGFESWLERDQLMMLDYSSKVRSFAVQPFWLSWPSGSKVVRHAPDIFVRMADGRGLVIDVRADDRIAPEDAAAFAATARACELVGWDYRRVGVVDPVMLANVKWLSGYRYRRCMSEPLRDRLVERFSQPTPLLEGAEAVGDRIAVLPSLFHLLWTQVLTADLRSAPLTGASMVFAGWVGR